MMEIVRPEMTFEPHISVSGSKYGYTRENIYYFDKEGLKEL